MHLDHVVFSGPCFEPGGRLASARTSPLVTLVRCAAVLLLCAGAAQAPLGAQTIDVPADATLQQAFGLVPSNGVIRIAQGTYPAPVGGFVISNPNRSFTVRAAPGATVVLDGGNVAAAPACSGGSRPVLVFENSTLDLASHVVFEELIIRNGCGSTSGGSSSERAGGITITRARASFINCDIDGNAKPVGTGSEGGGGGLLRDGSRVTFDTCIFQDNHAFNQGGALSAISGAIASISDSQFLRNRTNYPGHTDDSNGGAIALRASSLDAVRTRFEGNQAGVLGGAIFSLAFNGDAPVALDNCTFEDNHALNDPGVTPAFGRSGGAIYVEDLTPGFVAPLTISTSRFDENTAQAGGAIATFQSAIDIEQSVFRGNQVFGTVPGIGTGGAVSLVSGQTAQDAASLEVRNSLFWCRFGATTTAARAGGAIIGRGDTTGSVTLDQVAFVDCDVTGVASGAFELTLVDLAMTNSLVIDSDAPAGAGGASRTDRGSSAIVGTTFTGNTAGGAGGALQLRGQAIDLRDSQFFDNTSTAGQGSALATRPEQGTSVTGTVESTFFVKDQGLPLFEGDAHSNPINDLRYNDNTLFNDTVIAGRMFDNPIVGQLTVAQLNTTTVVRSSAANTPKSQVDNLAPGAAPSLGALLAVPSVILEQGAAGDVGETDAYLAGAWTGTSATLNGAPLAPTRGLLPAGRGLHTLVVDGLPFQAHIDSVPIFTDGFESGDATAWNSTSP